MFKGGVRDVGRCFEIGAVLGCLEFSRSSLSSQRFWFISGASSKGQFSPEVTLGLAASNIESQLLEGFESTVWPSTYYKRSSLLQSLATDQANTLIALQLWFAPQTLTVELSIQ